MKIKTHFRPNALSCACSILASLSHLCDLLASIATGNIVIPHQMFNGHHPQLTVFF